MTQLPLPVGNTVQPIAYVDLSQRTDYVGKFITLLPVDPQANERYRATALRLGFKFEGIFRQHMIIKGRNRDTVWYSMLDSEWDTIKKNMKTWLYQDPDRKLSLTALNSSRS